MAYQLGELFYKLALSSKEFESSIGNAEKRMKLFDEKMKKLGEDMTKYLTLPLVAAGAAAIKFGADAETAGKKFDKAFAGALDRAASAVERLNNQYGISELQAKQLLSNTGDLLKGFGATADQALDTSLRVQELAASLSAYSGVDITASSEKITKALLGETDGLKELGVAISAVDVEQKLLQKGQANLTGSALQLAKSQAVLEIAYSQSSDALSSFEQTSQSLNYMLKTELIGSAKDAAAAFGETMLPVVKELVEDVTNVLKGFALFDDGTKKVIIGIAATAAAIGPAVTMFNKLKVAIASNPIGLIATALTMTTTALIGLAAATKAAAEAEKDKWTFDPSATLEENQKRLAALRKEYEAYRAEVSKRAFVTQEEIDKVGQLAQRIFAYERSISSAAMAMDTATAAQKEAARIAQAKADAEARAAKEAERYALVYTQILEVINGQKTEAQKLDEEILKLQSVAWAKGSKQEQDRLKALEILQAKRQEITDEELAQIEELRRAQELAITDILQEILDSNKTEVEVLQEKYDKIAKLQVTTEEQRIAQLRALGIIAAQIKEKEAEALKSSDTELTQSFTDMLKDKVAAYEDYIKSIMNFALAINQIGDNLSKKEQQRIDDTLYYREQAIDQEIKALTEAAALRGGLTAEEEEQVKALENEKIKAKYEAEKAKYGIDLDAFNRKQALAIAEIAIQTSVAFVEALPNLILAGLVAALGAAQLATILTQPAPQAPKPPVYLANGGVVPQTSGGVPAIIGEGKYDELVAPLSDETFSMLGEAIVDSMSGTTNAGSQGSVMSLTIVLDGLGQTTLDLTQDALNRGVITIPSRLLIN